MLGGETITDTARQHAREMLKQSLRTLRFIRWTMKGKRPLLHPDVRLPDERQRLGEGRGPAAVARATRPPQSAAEARLRLPQHLRRAREGLGQAPPLARAPAPAEGANGPSCGSAWAAASPSSRARRCSSGRVTSTCSSGTHTLHRMPELVDGGRRRPGAAVDLDRKADAFAIPGELAAHGEPGARLRHGDGGLQPRLQLLRRAADARARGEPSARGHRPRGRGAWSRGATPRSCCSARRSTPTATGRDDFAGLLERVDAVDGLRRLRFTTSHPEHVDERMARRAARPAPRLPVPPPAVPVGVGPRPRLDAARLHAAAVPGHGRPPAGPRARPRALDRRDRRLSGGDRGRVRGDARGPGDGGLRRRSSPSRTRRARARRPSASPDDVPEEEKLRRLHVVNAQQQEWQRRRHEALVGRVEEVLVETIDGAGRVSGRTPHFRIVHLDGRTTSSGASSRVEITERRAERAPGPPFASGSLTVSSAVPIFCATGGRPAWKSR